MESNADLVKMLTPQAPSNTQTRVGLGLLQRPQAPGHLHSSKAVLNLPSAQPQREQVADPWGSPLRSASRRTLIFLSPSSKLSPHFFHVLGTALSTGTGTETENPPRISDMGARVARSPTRNRTRRKRALMRLPRRDSRMGGDCDHRLRSSGLRDKRGHEVTP